MQTESTDNQDSIALLAWHIAMGADEAIDEETIDRFEVAAIAATAQAPTKQPIK